MGWREVWSRRTLPDGRSAGLQDLIELDGFDTGAGRVDVADWREYARTAAGLLGLAAGHSVYEVGCGAGAFLSALREHLEIRIAGSDYSPSLIHAAQKAVPAGDFSVLEACGLTPEPEYDVVLANSLFHYFPDLSYAARVIERMIAKSTRAVAVFDVPDLSVRDAAERVRRDKLSAESYEKKYAGLEHLYYERTWFRDAAAAHETDCRLFASPIPNSAQGAFRFGAILTKR